MADINQVITLGVGTPADIEHFILVGLNVNVVISEAIIKTWTLETRDLEWDLKTRPLTWTVEDR